MDEFVQDEIERILEPRMELKRRVAARGNLTGDELNNAFRDEVTKVLMIASMEARSAGMNAIADALVCIPLIPGSYWTEVKK